MVGGTEQKEQRATVAVELEGSLGVQLDREDRYVAIQSLTPHFEEVSVTEEMEECLV